MTSISSAVRPQEPDREALCLMANAVHAVNRMAKHFKDRTARNRMYETKHSLLSWGLESDMPGLEVSWQRQADGDSLVVVTIGDRGCVHCPFERLSAAARCKVVTKVGSGERFQSKGHAA